jgi:hypothetical protein
MIYQISQDTGRSLRDVEKNYDLLIRDPKITGIQPDPSTMESIETAFTGAVTVGLATNPISTALGVASFMALDEAENAIISAVTDEEYELGGGKNISDLLPEDATRTSKEFVEILDLIGKGMIIGGVRNRTKGAFGRLSEQVTKKYIDEYKLPQDIYMDAGKVRSVLRGGKKDKFSPEEKDLLLDLNLSGSQYRKALSDGVTIRVPAEKVTKLVDRAWWGKVKETFGKPKSSEVVIRERAGELTEAPRGLLTEGRPIAQPKVEPPKVEKPKIQAPTPKILLKYKENITLGRNTLKESIETTREIFREDLGNREITEAEIVRRGTESYNLAQKSLKEFEKNPLVYMERSLESLNSLQSKGTVDWTEDITNVKSLIAELKKTSTKQPKLTQRESQELSDLKANLNTTFERLADPNRTNTQLLQDQRSAQRMIKLIQDKEPEFQAPELPFESDIKDVDASSLRQANIEASERVQHFSDTKAAKERVEDVERVSRAEITQFLRNAFDVTIRGKATHKMKGVAGFFSPVTKTVRSAITDDIYVLSHEVAHFIDNKIWGNQPKQRPHFRPWQNELGKLDYDLTKQRTSEGFAEFIRHFVSTGKAKELAPTFYDYFVGDFAKANPKIYEDILKLRDLMTRYNKQGSVERVKSQINFDGKPPKIPIKERISDGITSFRQLFLDDVALLESIFKKENISDLAPSKDPIQLTRMFKGKAKSKAENAILYNTTDYVGNITGDGLVTVLKPIAKNKTEIENFLSYAYARRALSRPDIDAGIELTDAQFVFDKFDSKKFRKASDGLSDWSDRILDYMVDSGGLSVEAKVKIKELNPIYLPLYRFFADRTVPKMKGKSVSGGKPVKGLKGSGRQILNPIESMIRYVENIYNAADKTRIAIALRDLSDQNILPGGYIEKVPPPTNVKTMQLKTVVDVLEKNGLGVFNRTGESKSESDLLTLFTVGKQYYGKENIIPIYEGEQVSFYEVEPKLYSMLKGLETEYLPPTLDLLFGKSTRMLKLGATGLNVAFSWIKNPIRDLSTYLVNSKQKFPNPAAPTISLLADLGIGSKQSKEAARLFKAQGGGGTTLMGRDKLTSYKKRVSQVLNTAQGGVRGNIKNITLQPVNTIRRILEVTESAPRIAEYEKKLKDYEKVYGKGSDDAKIAAFNDSQDVTINFSRMGEKIGFINQMTAFFNAQLQGGDKIYREAKNNPMSLIVRGLGVITFPTIYFWYQNKDKEWFQKLPSDWKYSHIYVDTADFSNKKDIVSLPLPHELGTLFGGITMAYLDEEYEKNPQATDEIVSQFLKQAVPAPVPTIIEPFKQAWANEKWYGAPIETRSMQRKEIPDRYTDYTLPIAKELSRFMYDHKPTKKFTGMLGIHDYLSPVMIENFVNSSTGGLAQTINDVATLGEKEIKSKADIPAVGKLFLRKEIYENRPTLDFDRFRLLQQKKVSKTITPEQQIELRKLEAEYKQYTRNRKRRELQKEMEQNTP